MARSDLFLDKPESATSVTPFVDTCVSVYPDLNARAFAAL